MNKVLSQSLVRDPFEIARSKSPNKVLSKSPVDNSPPMSEAMPSGEPLEASGVSKLLEAMGVDPKGLSLSDIGRMQLLGRFKKKYGDNYNQAPGVLDALSAFDGYLKNNKPEDSQGSVTAAERTLKAILG